jgi:Cu(I)/Ag(I) efflux system membrane fusion protein
MNAPFRGMPFSGIVTAAAIVAAAGAGLWAGQTGLVRLPMPASRATVAEAAQGQRKIIHYRNPMGLPDVSPVPKKDSMGMDYIPVYEGESEDGDTVKVSPGRIQRTGVKTEPVTKRKLSRTIHAPGVVAIDERSVTVIAPRFDGFVDKVGPVTSGSHVKKGDPLMTVFGQELLNQAARLLVEQYSRAATRGLGRLARKTSLRG